MIGVSDWQQSWINWATFVAPSLSMGPFKMKHLVSELAADFGDASSPATEKENKCVYPWAAVGFHSRVSHGLTTLALIVLIEDFVSSTRPPWARTRAVCILRLDLPVLQCQVNPRQIIAIKEIRADYPKTARVRRIKSVSQQSGINGKPICIYGGASKRAPSEHIALADSLGKRVGLAGGNVIFGGGSNGLMGAYSKAAQASGPQN